MSEQKPRGKEHFAYVKTVLANAWEEELQWYPHGRVPGQAPDPLYNPWMPFQLSEFTAFLAECVAAAEPGGYNFMDVGSGIGTKLAVADALFGMNVTGVERDEKMARHANDFCRRTVLGDAMDISQETWASQDIIWMYRPFRDSLAQAKLEHRIYECMKPGAIIAGGALEQPPNGFEIILDDWETGNRGAWKKPLDWQVVEIELLD